MLKKEDFKISTLGECKIPSPITDMTFVSDSENVSYYSDTADIHHRTAAPGKEQKCRRKEKFFHGKPD